MTTAASLTATCQPEPFTTAALVGALESAWSAIRDRHPEVPAVVLVVGSGSPARRTAPVRYGHFASLRWQAGDQVLPEVLVSGEGLKRSAVEVLTTLLHEAAHGLADRRGIKDTSRQGRWHNKHFAALAGELNLDAVKDDRLGWSVCTIRPATAGGYAQVLHELGAAMRAWRHVDEPGSGSTATTSNNGQSLACACPRKIRVATSVAEAGPILCGVCTTAFTAE